LSQPKTPKTPTPPTPPSPSEAAEQIRLASALDAAGLVWSATANGGPRSSRAGAALKKSGVKAGLPDCLIFTPAQGAPQGCAIELKRTKPNKGRLSPAQVIWLSELNRVGFIARVAYGSNHALELLRELGYELPTPPPITSQQTQTQQRSPAHDTPPPSRHHHKAMPSKR